jgi:hypothetical protein
MSPIGAKTHLRAGYATIVGPGVKTESDTCTCKHCCRVWVTRSSDPAVKGDLGGFCRICMRMICPTCAGKPCFPFEKKLDLYEKRSDLFKKMGLKL